MLISGALAIRPSMEESADEFGAKDAKIQSSSVEIPSALNQQRINGTADADLDKCKELARKFMFRGKTASDSDPVYVFENDDAWEAVTFPCLRLEKWWAKRSLSVVAGFAEQMEYARAAVQWLQRQLSYLTTVPDLEGSGAIVKDILKQLFNTADYSSETDGVLTKAVREIGQRITSFNLRCYTKSRYYKLFRGYYEQKNKALPSDCLHNKDRSKPPSCLESFKDPAEITNAVLTIIRSFQKDMWQEFIEACLSESERLKDSVLMAQLDTMQMAIDHNVPESCPHYYYS